jgi:outer membrane protein OmpA-like peptidoglycan-associated protein
MTSENAYRNYQIYEDSIERIGKGPKPAQETPGTVLSNGTNRVPQNPVKASSTDGRPRNFIIYFQDNSNTLSENDLETLDGLVSSFKNLPNSSIIIEGYTDSAGNYWNNKKLSKIRADIIKDHFIKNGIDAARIKALGMGPENPVESNENGTGRKSSHRVEIKLIPLDKIFILSKKQSASRKF